MSSKIQGLSDIIDYVDASKVYISLNHEQFKIYFERGDKVGAIYLRNGEFHNAYVGYNSMLMVQKNCVCVELSRISKKEIIKAELSGPDYIAKLFRGLASNK